MPYMSEAEDALLKMENALKRLSTQIVEQANVGNTDAAERLSLIAGSAHRIVGDLKIYVERFPDATKKDLRDILDKMSKPKRK